MKFMQAHRDWKRQQGEGKQGAAAAVPAPAPAEPKPAEPAAAPPAAKPEQGQPEGAQPGAAADAPTPKQLLDLMEKKPALKQLFDQDPEVKGQIFSMSRKLAELSPIGELFPSLGDAQFAADHTAQLVGLKTAAMRAVDNPANLPAALDLFDQQFQYVNDKGEPVLDAQGKPTYAPDRQVFLDGLYNRENTSLRGRLQGDFDQLKQKLASQVYPNDAARAMDQQKMENLEYGLMALQVLEQIRSGEFFQAEPPQLPADATPEMKAWFEQQQAELKQQREQLDSQRRGASREERQAAATKFNGEVRSGYAAQVGKMIGESIRQLVDSGVYIPEFYLQEKHLDENGRETETAAIAARLFKQFEAEIKKPGSRTAMTIAEHELLPQNEQTKAIRAKWYQDRAAEIVPRLVRAEADRIQKLVKADQDKLEQKLAARNGVAAPEPATGGSSLPQDASQQQLLTAAEEAAKKLPEWAQANPTEKQSMILTQYHRLKRPGQR